MTEKMEGRFRRGCLPQVNSTVLITGAAGFIGSNLCDRFICEGFRVIGIDNLITGRLENIEQIRSRNEFVFLSEDVTKPFVVDEKVDFILHFASPASPKDYFRFPIETIIVNSVGTWNMLEMAKKHNARFILASTSEVYGNPAVHPQKETYWGYVNPVGLRSVYDEGKRYAEALAIAYLRSYSLDVRVVRIFNTYGPRMRLDDGRAIPNFISAALRGDKIVIYGTGLQTRSFCFIDDIVEGIVRMTKSDKIKGEIINLGNPNEMSIADLVKLIISITGSKSPILNGETQVDDPERRCPDISKAERLLGWKPAISIEEGLKRTIQYFAELINIEGG